MQSKYAWKNLDIVNTLFLTLTPIIAIALTWYWLSVESFQWSQLIVAFVFYIFSGISITGGYHRLFAHRTYSAHPAVKLFFLIFGAGAFQNSVYKWATDHRTHHAKVDTEEDPYSIQEGFFHAHMGWVFLKKNSILDARNARDLEKDPLVMWQHKYYIWIAGFSGLILPCLVGGFFFDSYLGGLALGGFVKTVLIHHCTFFINSLCHYVGTTPYTDTNSAKDSWYMALFTFGEGYHNFHHYFQTDYRNGIRWYQFDPTKWLIKTLSWLNLASKLKVTPIEKILQARINMRIHGLKKKKISQDFISELENLQQKVLANLAAFNEMKKAFKIERKRKNEVLLRQIKVNMELAHLEFQYAHRQLQLKLQLLSHSPA